MEIAYIVVFLGLLIFLSHFFNAIFDKTRIPNAFLLLIIGIIVGPSFKLISPEDFGQLGAVFTTITLIVILFESGISLRFTELRTAIGSATILTVLNFAIMMVVMSVIFYYLTSFKNMGGEGWIAALFLGAILAGTSSAVVIPMVRQLKLGQKGQAVLVLESALSDVLCLVVGLALLDSMKAYEVNLAPLFNRIWQSFLFAIIIGLYAGVTWVFILQKMPKIKLSMFTTFAFAFVVYGVCELAGFNGGIATLAFGITMGNSDAFTSPRLMKKIFTQENICIETHEKTFYSEIVFILQTYFFVYIGINIQFGHPATYIVALLAVILNIFLRNLTVKTLSKKGLLARDRTIMSIMTPKGLVPAVLASIPLFMGINTGAQIQEIAYSVVFLSIMICSMLVIILEKNPMFFRNIFKKSRPIIEETDTFEDYSSSKEGEDILHDNNKTDCENGINTANNSNDDISDNDESAGSKE